MNNEVKELLVKTKQIFPTSFINENNELIFEPKNNLYFRLEDIDTELDFKCKLMAWLSRPIAKGLSVYWQKKMLKSFNELLETNFTKQDMYEIYTYLGENVNKELCVKFIESNYDLSVFKGVGNRERGG